MGKIIFAFGLILFACLLFWNKPAVKNAHIIVQPDIVKNPIYKKLDKQKEAVDLILYGDNKMQAKTSDVSYRDNRDRILSDTTYAKIYVCRAYIDKGAVRINIGNNGVFGGNGFNINLKNSNFNIIPYYSTDASVDGLKTITSYNIIKQQLVLNKSKYSLGDSVFGYVDFNLIEKEKSSFKYDKPQITRIKKITHIGYGYFRGKITKL